jgi:hypothetical protein
MGVKDLAPPPEILRLSRSLKPQDDKTGRKSSPSG